MGKLQRDCTLMTGRKKKKEGRKEANKERKKLTKVSHHLFSPDLEAN